MSVYTDRHSISAVSRKERAIEEELDGQKSLLR